MPGHDVKLYTCPTCGRSGIRPPQMMTLSTNLSPAPGSSVIWGFISPETGDFIGVTEDGMRTRWGAPTPEELDDLLAQISAAGYASEACAIVEDWTLRRWDVVSAFTKREHERHGQE